MAGKPSPAARSTSRLRRAAPSRRLYSEWTCRWTKSPEAVTARPALRPSQGIRSRGPAFPGAAREQAQDQPDEARYHGKHQEQPSEPGEPGQAVNCGLAERHARKELLDDWIGLEQDRLPDVGRRGEKEHVEGHEHPGRRELEPQR